MRKGQVKQFLKYKILVVDDEPGVIESIQVVLGRSGYTVFGETNPLEAVKRLRSESFDMLILDFLMSPIHGDKVVELVRQFNTDLYILLLTGYKDLAPPMETMRALDIQGYCEKSNRFNQLVLLVESGIKSVAQMETIRNFRDGLQQILSITPKIYRLQPVGDNMREILEEAARIFSAKDTFLVLDSLPSNDDNEVFFYGTGAYKNKAYYQETLGSEMLEQLSLARAQEGTHWFAKGVMIPLRADGRHIGVMFISYDRRDDDTSGLVGIFASQVVAAVENAYLHSALSEKSEEINRAYTKLHERYLDMVEALRAIVNTRDVYTRGHSDRVCYYSTSIGKALCLDEAAINTLNIGSKFHDIGKIGTPDSILLKKGPLTVDEFDEIKKHPRDGEQILAAMNMFQDILPLVRSHHERIDGHGYPDGISGDEIPLLVRIITVADAFDAMASDRPYRGKISLQEALAQLEKGSGTQFDTHVVKVFVRFMKENAAKVTKDIAEMMEREFGSTENAVDLSWSANQDYISCLEA